MVKPAGRLDLHVHLDGAVRTRTIFELAASRKVRLPASSVQALERHVTAGPRCRSLADFLACFDVFLPALRSAEAVERIAYELCEDQAAAGVDYVEARYAPFLQEPEVSIEASVEAALEGLRRGGRDFGIRWTLVLCGLRTAPDRTMDVARAAVRTRGVTGLDLAGDERAPLAPHAPAFRFARRKGLPFTLHAGEAGPASNVREAIELGAVRIGHGLAAVEDADVLKLAAKRRVTFEICLTSNLQTRAVTSLRHHPALALRAAGVPIVLSTDDPAVCRTSLNREYELAQQYLGFGPREFREIEDNARKAAFASV